MRVLYLNADPGVPVFGPKGASVHVRAMATALARAGHEVIVLAARGGEAPAAAPRFLVMPEVAPSTHGVPAEEAETLAIDRNHVFRDAMRRLGRSFRPDLIYERHSLWCDAGVEAARALGVPHLLEANAPLIEESVRFRSLHHGPEAEAIAGRVFSGTSAALAVSRAVMAYARHHGARRLRHFPNAVDAAMFRREPRDRSDASTLTLGFCGGLRPWHGIEALVEILARVRREVPYASLLVVGDGPGREALERAAVRHGVSDAVQATGAVDHEAVPGWLDRMDVALAPYPRIEPFYFSPLKVFEYQAAGLPVVAAQQGDLPLYVEHRRTGVLAEPGNVADMARWVVALHHDRPLAASLGAAARAEVLYRHTWERRVEEVAELVRSLVPAAGVRA